MKALGATVVLGSHASADPQEYLGLPNEYSKDLSKLTPEIVRKLLDVFDRCIRPVCFLPAARPQRYEQDLRLNHIPPLERFHVLISCAIAARTLSISEPSWLIIAKLCREWSDDLSVSIVTTQDKDAVIAVLLLSIYEMVDPSRGIIWDLIGLATRICLQLGWHRVEQSTGSREGESDTSPSSADLMGILQTLQRSAFLSVFIVLFTSSMNRLTYI